MGLTEEGLGAGGGRIGITAGKERGFHSLAVGLGEALLAFSVSDLG